MERFSHCFGFVEEEVDRLFRIYLATTKMPKITRKELEVWYDGYHTAAMAEILEFAHNTESPDAVREK